MCSSLLIRHIVPVKLSILHQSLIPRDVWFFYFISLNLVTEYAFEDFIFF